MEIVFEELKIIFPLSFATSVRGLREGLEFVKRFKFSLIKTALRKLAFLLAISRLS
jgi:hypothetical protein